MVPRDGGGAAPSISRRGPPAAALPGARAAPAAASRRRQQQQQQQQQQEQQQQQQRRRQQRRVLARGGSGGDNGGDNGGDTAPGRPARAPLLALRRGGGGGLERPAAALPAPPGQRVRAAAAAAAVGAPGSGAPVTPRLPRSYRGSVRELYGPDVAAAFFVLSCGGSARFQGRDEWLRPDARGGCGPELLRLRDLPVVAVDLSGSAVDYGGLDDLARLTQLQHLDLSGCRRVDDWSLARLHTLGASLRELSLAGCPRVTERGLAALHHLRHLRRLDVSDLPAVRHPGLTRILLEEMLPRCQVVGMDYADGLEPPPLPAARRPP